MRKGSRKLSRRIEESRRRAREFRNQQGEDDATNAGQDEDAKMWLPESGSSQYAGDVWQTRNIFS
jgi:hypothetical protein